jgi:hypothetical protein
MCSYEGNHAAPHNVGSFLFFIKQFSCKVFQVKVSGGLGGYLDPRQRRWQDGESCIIRSFIICRVGQIVG